MTSNPTTRTRDAELRRQRQVEAQAIADALAQATARLRESGGAPNVRPSPSITVASPSGGTEERGMGTDEPERCRPTCGRIHGPGVRP